MEYSEATESMIVIDSTWDICWYTNYKSRTSWITFNTSSQIAWTSTIYCLSSSADPRIFSRLLRMALPSLTLGSSSYFFCLMASGIWARVDLWWSMAAFMFSSSFSSSARLISSWDNSRSVLREEFFKSSINYVSSLASCMLEFPLASKASWLDKFLWVFFTFRPWSSKIHKDDKILERAGDGLLLMAKRTLCIESVSWIKSAIFFSSIGNTSLSQFLVSSDKASLKEVADELTSSSSKYSPRLKE